MMSDKLEATLLLPSFYIRSKAFQEVKLRKSIANKIGGMKRRELNAEERGEAERLATAWKAFKAANRGATQEWLGAETGLGSQGAVGQYLRGVIPLNLEALMAFSKVLKIDPRTISTRETLASLEQLMPNTVTEPAVAARMVVSLPEEMRLLTAFRLADEIGRDLINSAVDDVMDALESARRYK